MSIRYKIEEVFFIIINFIQEALNSEEVDESLVFLQQLHFELKRIKMEIQEFVPVIIKTKIGKHVTLIIKTKIFNFFLASHNSCIKNLTNKRLLSPFFTTPFQDLERR